MMWIFHRAKTWLEGICLAFCNELTIARTTEEQSSVRNSHVGAECKPIPAIVITAEKEFEIGHFEDFPPIDQQEPARRQRKLEGAGVGGKFVKLCLGFCRRKYHFIQPPSSAIDISRTRQRLGCHWRKLAGCQQLCNF